MENITKYGDVGNPKLLDKKGIEIRIVEGQPRAVVRNVSPIHTYYARGQITLAQFSAGKALYEAYITAWHSSGNYEIKERTQGGKPPEQPDRQIRAIERYLKGIAYAGDDYQIIKDVVIAEIPIAQLIKSPWERNKMKNRMRRGLTNMAKGFGY